MQIFITDKHIKYMTNIKNLELLLFITSLRTD